MAAVACYFDLLREMKNRYNRNRYCGLTGSKVIHHLLVTQSDVETAHFDKATYAGNPENIADIAGNHRY
jgi:hypothetical protein